MPTTSVLIGSYPSIPETSVQVTANASQEELTWVVSTRYLAHGTSSLSLVTGVAALFNTHTQLANTTCTVTRSGRVRIFNSTSFTIDSWGSDTTLRDMLGFTGTAGSATTQVASGLSPLYWAAGKTESPMARLGADGVPVHDTFAARSAPGRVVATTNNSWHRNAFTWRYVDVSRFETVPSTNGTWAMFWDQVVRYRRRFYLARNVTEDSSDTTTVMTLTNRIPTSLPYIWRNDGPDEREHRREIANLELYGHVELEVETATEYS